MQPPSSYPPKNEAFHELASIKVTNKIYNLLIGEFKIAFRIVINEVVVIILRNI